MNSAFRTWTIGTTAAVLMAGAVSAEAQTVEDFYKGRTVTLLVGAGLAWYLRTESGAALRATGDNARMLRALGTSTDRATVIGLALARSFA